MRLFRLCERSSEWGVAQTTQLLRSRTLSPSFTRNRRDLFQHGGNCPPTGPEGSNLVPPLARKFSAFSKIQVVCKSSQVIMHGKLNIKPKSENVDAVEEKFENCNRILSGGNNVKEEKRRGRKTSAAICGKIEPVVTGESTRLSEGIAATRENVPRASSTYNKKKMFEIYQQSLLFQASRRIVRGKMKEMQVDTDTSVKSLKRKLFAMNMRDHTEDKKLVSEEDIERTATILQAQEKSNPKLLPFDMSLLRKAVRCLNDEMLGSAERKALFFCAKNVDSIERCFENAKIGTQICIMSNKLPLALPIITTAFRKRLFYIERIRKVDLSFDCSSLKSEKYQQIFCLFFKHAGLADPRVSYVDWALELLSRDHLTPSLEFLVSSLTLLGKCNDKCGKGKELLKQIMSHGKIGWSDIEGFSMGELQSFASNILPRLAKLYEVELEVDKIFPRFESAAQEQLFKRYSMIASQDICVPMSSDKIPPQYKLTDILTYDQLIHNYHRQLKYENLVNVPVTSIEAVDCDVQSAKTTNGKKGRSLKGKERSSQQNLREIDDVLKDWHRKMTDEIVEALHLQKRGNFFDKDLYEVLQVIDLNALVDHLIEIALTIGANEIAMPHFEISNQIEQFLFNSFYQQYLMRTRYMEKLDIIYPKFAKLFFEEDESLQVSARDKWISLQNEYSELGPGIHDFPSQWSAKSCSQLCRLLITILLKHCQVPTNVAEKFSLRGFENDQNVHSRNSRWRSLPCLSFRYITQNSSYTGARSATIAARTHLTVYPHLFFTLMARETNRSKIKMLATCIPTLVPPVPWCSQNHGGYLVSPCQFMRIGMSSEAWTLVKEALLKKVVVNDPDMDAIYDSVYTFSSVPWRINRQVFDVVSHLFKSGGDLQLDIPLDQKNMRLHLEKNHPSSPKKGNELQIFKRAKELKQAETDNYGLRMSLLYQLSIADRLKNEKAFWFPSNMDFRGRCYDIPPVFNHIGDDKTRALLMFAQGKPLGETGFMWLKLQFASLSGNCKRMGYSDRLQYVDSHMDLILDSAAKPLSGFRWWTTLDEPFQCLACCFEISNAVKSGDIAKYVSHLPIHQDGSCNGLQHYAALGRDSEGAVQVNVLPGDEPQDVYQAVSDIVEKQRKLEKCEQFVEICKNLQGMINRKVVKQTVMTQVYGVTFYGGRQQIQSKLKDASSLQGQQLYTSASYITKQVFDGVQDLFTATAKIKQWLRTMAWYLSEAGIFTEWVSPLGLPIVQPYSKKATRKYLHCGNSSIVTLKNKPNSTKQRNAFAPNYIHCLDAAHMLLTSHSCFKNGVSFVHVHDCFWTHACSVEEMNRICRDEFIKLHSLPLLNDLSNYVLENLVPKVEDPDLKIKLEKHLRNIPERGDLNLERVKDSTFFFS